MTASSRITQILIWVSAAFLFTLGSTGAHAQEIRLFGLGPALQHEDVRRALLHAVNWNFHLDRIYGDPYLPVVLIVGDADPIYNFDLDPETAGKRLDDVLTGEELTLIYAYEPSSAELALAIEHDLERRSKANMTIREAISFDDVVDYVEGPSQDRENILILLGLAY